MNRPANMNHACSSQLAMTHIGRDRTIYFDHRADCRDSAAVPCQRTFLFVIQSSSPTMICHSTFLALTVSPTARALRCSMRAERCCWPGFCLTNLHWHKRLPRGGKTGQVGHHGRDALSSKIPHRRSQARAEQSGLTRDRGGRNRRSGWFRAGSGDARAGVVRIPDGG